MRFLKTLAACAVLMSPVFAFAEPVDINTADAEAISQELNGIGLAKAKAIVEYRKKHGPFRSVEDLSLVKGIGERTVERNRADMTVGKQKK